MTANGSFYFSPHLSPRSGAYAVTVLYATLQHLHRSCSVSPMAAESASANVSNIAVNCGHNEWAWMSGSNVANKSGTYGTLGVAAADQCSGSVGISEPVSWTDTSGNLWLFGGNALDSDPGTNYSGDLNDFWKYNIASGQWTWVSGSNFYQRRIQNGNYGTLNTAAWQQTSRGRGIAAVSWIDASGNLWLFGGEGNDSTGAFGYLNDLWEYSVSTNDVDLAWAGRTWPTKMALLVRWVSTDATERSQCARLFYRPKYIRTSLALWRIWK